MARLVPLLLSAALAAAGCAYDEGKDLPEVVERATPAEATLVAACGGSSGLIDEPSHDCTFLVRGNADAVTASVGRALARDGFTVSCRSSGDTVAIAALRGDVRVSAEVTSAGAVSAAGGVVNVHGRGLTHPGDRPIPRGSVALELTASRQPDASESFQRAWVRGGFACAQDEIREQSLRGCSDAWNAPQNEINRRLVLRRMRVPVAYVILRSNGPGVAKGCFFGFLAHRGRYLMLESTWMGDQASFGEPELGYASGKGRDANARVRPDGTLVLKRPSLNRRCADWWNAEAGWELRERALERGLVGDLSASYTEGVTPRCDYVLRTATGFLAGSVTFDHGRWVAVQLAPIERPSRFRPNGALASSGWLTVGP